MNTKVFYGFQDPMKAPDSKIGISKNPKARLGTYQNSYSSRSHIAQFDWAFYGEASVINRLEKKAKEQFDWDIEKDGRGHSEWIWNHTSSDTLAKIQKLIEGFNYKVYPVSKQFLPLTVYNIDSFFESIKNS
jgi:hypothetical protein